MAVGFQKVRVSGRDTPECIGRADFRDGAFVAIHATVVAHLKEERSIAKSITTFDTFGAADAQLFINGVFVIWIFDKAAPNGSRGTELVLRAGVQVVRLGL